VIDSYKSLLPDSAGNTVVLLAQISRQLDGISNGTHVPSAASTSFSPDSGAQQSSPPASAVWVNSLWFLSLVISLFCALLATLQQRWARRYLGLTRPQVAIHKRGHIHSFLAEGINRFNVHYVVEAIPALLHVSVFLFLAGLVISLFTIHHTVAYITLSATVVCFLVYVAITVMPVVYYDSPYTSPFSTLAWYISRKIIVTVLNGVDYVAKTLQKSKESFDRWRSATSTTMTTTTTTTKTTTKTASPPDRFSYYKTLLSGDMTKAIYAAAMRPDAVRDARALGWTLDRLDEEGELVQFAAGIPGFSRSTRVDKSMSILEMVPMLTELHSSLSWDITKLLIRASKPGLLRGSKLLPEPVREQRLAVCQEGMYYLPHAIKTLLERIVECVLEEREAVETVGSILPVVLSVESWILAVRLSVSTASRVDRAVKIGAQCMATVIASQPPPCEQSLSILMRHWSIEEPYLNRYLEQFDSILLKNLNHFLIHTAFDVIEEAEVQHHIDLVVLTVRLAKRLKFEHAVPELRKQFKRLRYRTLRHLTESSGKTKKNATKLLLELNTLTTDPPDPPDPPSEPPVGPVTGPRAHTWPTDAQSMASAPTSANPPQTSQNPSMRWPLQPVSQTSNDAYISMDIRPQHDTLPLVPVSPSL